VTTTVLIRDLCRSLANPKPTELAQRSGKREMGTDPKQGEGFVKVPMPRETGDDTEGHKV
jgi:hypothetical protein